MSKKFRVLDCDIIYLSYDEPNAEKNYADLCAKVPWAKRVHGVKGSDAAHKACAEISETQRFITVDGDNIIHDDFVNQEIEFEDHVDLENSVISWCGKNVINGLIYGNGGLKCWPKKYVQNMQTHENANPSNVRAQVDFCWDLEFIQQNNCYSDVHNNSTPCQAWRAGFREGVKMSLNKGLKVPNEKIKNLHWKNLHRLYVWSMVGSDIHNGLWAIYGARQGLYMTTCTDWNHVNVRDFDWLNDHWSKYKNFDQLELLEKIEELGVSLRTHLDLPISVSPLDSEQSKFFKTVYINPSRVSSKPVLKKHSFANETYDIVFISYNEPNAEENWKALTAKFPRAKRVHGVKGIHQAHIEAAKKCNTDMIWIVDADAQIIDEFNFDYAVPEKDKSSVHVWRCKNKLKNLEYGYGGVKLLPRNATLEMDTSKPDVTTSISSRFKIIDEVANSTEFNTDPFNAWKSGFRECAKLASKVIDRQEDVETEIRLNAWCSNEGNDKLFGNYVTQGAKSGRLYGELNKGNLEALKLINDFDWLKKRFDDL
jgi:hypothetical protein